MTTSRASFLMGMMKDIDSIGPGEIYAIFGVECSSGDTFTDGTTSFSMVRLIDLSLSPTCPTNTVP